MTNWRRYHFALALFFSLLLHLLLLGSLGWLGWRVPTLDDLLHPESPPQLDAQLVPVVPRKMAAPAAKPAPPRRKPSHRPPPARPAVAEAVSTPMPAPAPAELPPPDPVDRPPDPADQPPAPEVPTIPAGVTVPEASQAPMILPRQGRIRFVVSRGDQGFVVGQSVHRWRHDGKIFTFSSVTETTGIAALFRPVQVKQTSEGEIAADGLRPRVFATQKDGSAGDAAVFDWTAMRLTLAPGGGSRREVPLVSVAQDMLSMFYQLGIMLSGLPPDRPSTGQGEVRASLVAMVATGKKFARYAFQMLGEEQLPSKHGAQRALHLRSVADGELTEVWLGLELRDLPLKIRYTDRQGESYDQVAEDIEFEGMPGATGGQ